MSDALSAPTKSTSTVRYIVLEQKSGGSDYTGRIRRIFQEHYPAADSSVQHRRVGPRDTSGIEREREKEGDRHRVARKRENAFDIWRA